MADRRSIRIRNEYAIKGLHRGYVEDGCYFFYGCRWITLWIYLSVNVYWFGIWSCHRCLYASITATPSIGSMYGSRYECRYYTNIDGNYSYPSIPFWRTLRNSTHSDGICMLSL